MEANSQRPFVFYTDQIGYKSVDENGTKKYFVKGYCSTSDIDLVDDIVSKDCLVDMESQFKSNVLKLDFEHEAFRGNSTQEVEINKTKSPLGKAVEVELDQKGLNVTWELNPNWNVRDKDNSIVKSFKEVWEEVKSGFLDAFSIAFIPVDSRNVKTGDGTKARILEKVRMLNVALTGNPVNTTCKMLSIMAKSRDFLQEKMSEETKTDTTSKEETKSNEETQETKSQEMEVKSLEANLKSFKDEVSAEIKSVSEEVASIKKSLEETNTKDEITDLKAQMEKKDEEIANLKSDLEKARVKSVSNQESETTKEEVKSGPTQALDMIS